MSDKRADEPRERDAVPRALDQVAAASAAEPLAAALRDSEERFRFLAENIPVQIWTALPDGRLDYVTEQTAGQFGLTAERLLADGWQNVVHPEDLALAVERWTHALATGDPYEVEFRLKLWSGEYAWHLARAVPQRSASGVIARWFGTNTNIEEQREQQSRTQRLLAQVQHAHRDAEAARAELHSLFMQAPSPICVLRGHEHTFTLANPAYMRFVGPARTLVGLPVRSAMPEMEGQGFFEILDRVYTTGQRYTGLEVPAKFDRRGDGTLDDAFVNAAYEPFCDLYGDVAGILVIASDVTDIVRAREAVQATLEDRERMLAITEDARWKAEHASRAKDEFLATASHELRTPLNAILGWARMLRSGTLDASGYSRGVETIERNARSQVQLVEDILDGSRIITGKLHLEIRTLDLTAVVQAALDAVRPAAAAKSIALDVTLDPDAARIKGDPDRLQQVVWNLVNNAMKFTPKDGRVEVRLARVGTSIELSVKDNGQGIHRDFLPYVFERFRQADASTTRRYGGLGLALVRHLAEAHGGTVRAESEGEGRGATFVVTLPVQAVFHDAVQSSRPTPIGGGARAMLVPNSLGKTTVLVTDDEPDARALVATALRAHGAEVRTASSVDEALACLAQRSPMVLISDIGMPGEDGYALIRRVRALGTSAAKIPAIALTAYAREEDRRRALAAGFQTYLAKPVEPDDLVRVVGELARA